MKKTCNAITSKGEKCGLPAGYQTAHKGVGRCKFHDGRDHVEKLVSDIKHDSSFIIIDRNINLINHYLDKLALGQSNIVSNNILRDCINEIAIMEQEDVKVTATEQGIQIDIFNNTPLEKEYVKLTKSIYKMFEDRANKILENYHDNKVKFEKQSVIDTNLEPSKTEDDIHVEQSESKQEKYQNICIVIFVLLILVGGSIMVACMTTYSADIGLLSIIVFAVTTLGFRFWVNKKGYWKFLTQEEKEARRIKWETEKEARMRKWGAPIKSAHIIRLERGLYTGLGNRRPYPHGRRTKKY